MQVSGPIHMKQSAFLIGESCSAVLPQDNRTIGAGGIVEQDMPGAIRQSITGNMVGKGDAPQFPVDLADIAIVEVVGADQFTAVSYKHLTLPTNREV